jgi:uncharacterized protein
MTALHAVAATLALLALGLTLLSLNVSRLRLKHRVSFGDGGHKDLLLAVRAHGNTLEQALLYAPLALAHALLAAGLFGRQLRLRQLAHLASVAVQGVLAVVLLGLAARAAGA